MTQSNPNLAFHPVANIFPLMDGKPFEDLCDSIQANGLLEPIWTYKGQIIDGRNRYRACIETGASAIFRTWEGEESGLVPFVVALNLTRRHLNESQRAMVAANIARLERGSNQHTAIAAPSQAQAAKLLNVSPDSIQRAKSVQTHGAPELVQAVESGAVAVSTAAVIASKPVEEQKVIVASTPAEILKAAKEIKREARVQRVAALTEKQAKAVEANHPLCGESYILIQSDIRSLEEKLDGRKFDAIITDPPYPVEYVPLLGDLSVLASRVLKPGGHCLVMFGQSHLGEAMRLLEQDLAYQWTIAYLTPGQSTQVFGRRVKSNWKPVLWYVNGKTECEHVEDTIKSGENDKRFHEWGQSVSGMVALIERFTLPKALILDPFVGAGTTGVAAIACDRLFVGADIDASRVAQSAERMLEVRNVA